MKKLLGILIGLAVLTGCFEKETPIDPYPRGDVQEQVAELGPKYTHQVFYNFSQNAIVKSVLRTDWEIAFNCTPGNQTIYLNTGNNVYAATSDKTSLSDVTDTSGLDFKWDWSNGFDDSTALYNWESNPDVVHVVDLGLGLDNKHRGFARVKFSMEGEDLVIEHNLIGESEVKKSKLTKDETYNRVYFSLANNSVADIEPPKENYDLIFRQYIYYFEEEAIPYSVVGALLNPYKTSAAYINKVAFLDITLDDTIDHPFVLNHDVVGYEWKEFNLSEGFYVVYPEMCFIIRNSEGFYYKFHFTDFYNTDGDRGYPKVEWKLL